MSRLVIICVLMIMLISSFSLTLQSAYKTYGCDYDKQYLSLSNTKITICGATCDFQYMEGAQQEHESSYSFNYGAPPLYFENTDTFQFLGQPLNPNSSSLKESYDHLLSDRPFQPPRLS